MFSSFWDLNRSPWSDKASILGYTLLALILGQIVSLAIYRIYFHPLSAYPGPKLAAITSSYRHLYLLLGCEERHALVLHQKYGPVVRYGPDFLIYADARAWKDIYGHRIGGKQATRKFLTFADRYPGHSSLITAPSEEDHARLRRIFSHAFSEQALRKQEPMFQHYIDLLIKNLHQTVASKPDVKLNMVDYYNFTTFDIMSDLTFSEPLGMLENSKYSPWVQRIYKAIKASSLFFVAGQYPLLSQVLMALVPAKLKEELADNIRFAEEKVDRRIAKTRDQPDIWNLVLNQKGDRALSIKEMYTNADLFMLAGTETTASLMSGMTYYLLKTPHAWKKLRDELDASFQGGKDITADKLVHLPYLRACITEALRIYPPSPLTLFRIIPPGGAMVAGNWVPGYTKVGICHCAAFRLEGNFALPLEYHPERWLSDFEDPRFKNDNRQMHEPFSYGPRNCIGQNMAWMEMRMIAAKTYTNFDMQLCEQSGDWQDQKIYSLWEKKPLLVKLRARS